MTRTQKVRMFCVLELSLLRTLDLESYRLVSDKYNFSVEFPDKPTEQIKVNIEGLPKSYWQVSPYRAIAKEHLWLSKISKCLSGWVILFIILADAHFPHDTPHKSVFDLLFARCAPAGEPGSAPPNRRASAIRKEIAQN